MNKIDLLADSCTGRRKVELTCVRTIVWMSMAVTRQRKVTPDVVEVTHSAGEELCVKDGDG